jgi:sigma-B regulation protein RsbU (phosphoserine phosphatase)
MQPLPPRAEVTVYSPLFSPFRQTLDSAAVSIGRASDCTIPVKDRYLSRRHAEILTVDGAWMVKDLGSANGTYLNGNRLEHDSLLKSGDRIRLGDTEIVFICAESSTDRISVSKTTANATIVIPLLDIDRVRPESQDVARLQTLTLLARELIEDRPMSELFGFITERVMQHLQPSRAAVGLLASDGQSFINVEVRRKDPKDTSELTISQTLLNDLVQEKKALAYMDVNVDEKLSRAHSIIAQGIHSIICAPIMIGGSIAGVLYVDFLFNQHPISEDDVRLVAQIASFAALKLEQTRLREEAIEKRLIDEELKTASAIQRRLLPDAPVGIAGYAFAATNRACRSVSGDYYDFVVRPDGRVYFVIADVSGKGVTAGLMMAGLQASFRIFCKSDPDPAALVSDLNVALKENLPQSKFVTLFLGRLDTHTGAVEYVNAGHTPPLLVRRDSVEELAETDPLLGVITLAEYANRRIQLEPGDALILFTDGVNEVENAEGEVLGTTGLAESVGPLHGASADVLATVVDATVIAHAGEVESLGDDVTVVVVSRTAASEAFGDATLIGRRRQPSI